MVRNACFVGGDHDTRSTRRCEINDGGVHNAFAAVGSVSGEIHAIRSIRCSGGVNGGSSKTSSHSNRTCSHLVELITSTETSPIVSKNASTSSSANKFITSLRSDGSTAGLDRLRMRRRFARLSTRLGGCATVDADLNDAFGPFDGRVHGSIFTAGRRSRFVARNVSTNFSFVSIIYNPSVVLGDGIPTTAPAMTSI